VKLELYDGSSWDSVATESFVNTKVFDINSNTSGSLNINRLQGYPSSVNAFLRGDGAWTLPYINNLLINGNVSLANFSLSNVSSLDVGSLSISTNIIQSNNSMLLSAPSSGSGITFASDSGRATIAGGSSSPGQLRMGNNSGNFVGLQAPASIPNTITWVLPNVDGSAGYPLKTDGTKNLSFGTIDINAATSGNLNISRLSGYPANSSVFLRGDGVWASPSSSLIDINSGTTGQLNISRLSGYPSNSSLFLNGAGSWVDPLNVTVNASAYNILVNNLNSSATNTGLIIRNNGNNAVEFGYNTSTNEAYVWAASTATLKFGTSAIKRMELLNNGMLNVYYGLTVTGNINAQTGTLIGNNLAAYNSGSIVCINPLAMNNNSITGLANPSSSQDAATKSYVDNKVFDINNNTTSQLSISRLSGYPANSSLFLRGDGAWATPSGGGLGGSQIGVNTDSGSSNWLRKSNLTRTGIQVYGLTSTSFIIENNVGESSGIGFDADSDACTIWTPGDSGGFLNIQDEDATNTRVAYVATTGAWTVVSSEQRKHSIRNKSNNNVLERFLKLSVKTYGYKYPVEKGFMKKKEKRIERKSNKMATGLILEEVFKIFPNCIPDYYNPLFQKKRKNRLRLEKEIKDIKNAGIDYNTLMCYFIMAFQELAKKVDFLEQKL
jgi:hypothetical protein